jgi:hypothetical protein
MKQKKKEICYPIFLQVSQFTKDNFWIFIFEDLAFGITPFGTYIDNSKTIHSRLKGKQFNYNFSNKTSKEIYNDLIDIFKNKLKIFSKLDYYIQKTQFDKMLEEKNKDWKDIKKKNIKDILIENYVIEMKQKYSLSVSQTQKLLHCILLGFNFKLLINKDVNYDSEECKIKNISSIQIQPLKLLRILKSNDDKYYNITTDDFLKLNLKDYWSKFLYNSTIEYT